MRLGKPYKVVQYATDMTQQTLIVEQLQEAVHQTQDIVKQSIAGDLTVRIAAGSMSGEIAQMVNDANALLNARMVLVGRVKSLTVEVPAASEEIAKGNDTLSRVTEGQAASLEETAASLEQMTSTVKITADNAAMASSLAAAARQQAETGGGVVTAAVAAMEQIRTSSNKIADIIIVIDISPSKRIDWCSMRQWRRRGPAIRAADLPLLRAKCAIWRVVARPRQRRSSPSSRTA